MIRDAGYDKGRNGSDGHAPAHGSEGAGSCAALNGEEAQRYADNECGNKAVNQRDNGLAAAVEVAVHKEYDADEDAVDGIRTQTRICNF